MTILCGLVIISHSQALAEGVVELAGQMAPDVQILAAGGMADGTLGTDYDLIENQVVTLLDAGLDGVVVLTDIGSATLAAESALEFLDDSRAVLADAPLVEGAVAAAVAAQTGGDVTAVLEAAISTIYQFDAAQQLNAGQSAGQGSDAGTDSGDSAAETGLSRIVRLNNKTGLHARPAAVIARLVSDHDATVTINGTDAASLLSLMALAIPGGAEVEIVAAGPAASQVLDVLAAEFAAGFNED